MTRYADPVLPAVFIDNQETLRPFDKDLITALGSWSLNLKGILDKGIDLDDNIDAAVVQTTTNSTPDTEDAIAHTLGKVPTYFIVADIDKAGIVYRTATAWTKTTVYVKTSVASAAVKLILL